MDKTQIMSHIKMRKLEKEINETATKAINAAGGLNDVVLSNLLATAMKQTEGFDSLFKSAAALYVESNYNVDLRMQAGLEMLKAVSQTDLDQDALGEVVPLIPLTTKYGKAQLGQAEHIITHLQTVTEHFRNEDTADIAAKALFLAMRQQHPTLTQCFLSSFRNAARSISEDKRYLNLGYAFNGAIPFI
ncbi:hypothetical protein [Vibrio sp. D431a]|uniref:hypothetical protein n=1 Tax=Vibrio sp. D431a TaxID=2837388 RepID=UPI002555289F|nr:hypothetical protein [Vibrio sp. D431a]MDK9793322.1 hypothetical protein [Vibrio sp. D431a]